MNNLTKILDEVPGNHPAWVKAFKAAGGCVLCECPPTDRHGGKAATLRTATEIDDSGLEYQNPPPKSAKSNDRFWVCDDGKCGLLVPAEQIADYVARRNAGELRSVPAPPQQLRPALTWSPEMRDLAESCDIMERECSAEQIEDWPRFVAWWRSNYDASLTASDVREYYLPWKDKREAVPA